MNSIATYFQKISHKKQNVLFWALILFFTWNNYFKNYWHPPQNIWDETFHVAAAAKYIQKIHFMEPHPPLGKLLIAAGEILLRPISGQWETFNLEKTEEAANYLPQSFTPIGYRFFPVLFSCINAILFTLLLLHFLKSKVLALAFSPLYLFENSLIAHFRAAMLDSFLIFGVLVSLYAFFKLVDMDFSEKNKSLQKTYFALHILGFSFAVLSKAFGFILILLWPLLLFLKKKSNDKIVIQRATILQFIFFLVFFHIVWFLHFHLGQNINPHAPNKGFYTASKTHQKILKKEAFDISPFTAFYVQLADNLKYAALFQRAVHPLNINQGSISGSFPMMWPFGSKTINYLESANPPDHDQYALSLVPNPINWLSALIALLLLSGILVGHKISNKLVSEGDAKNLFVLGVLYISYMIPLFFIRRILYLNHYLTPLLLSFFIMVIIWKIFYERHPSKLLRYNLRLALYIFPILSISAFMFFKPLSYIEPLSCNQMNKRMGLFRFWDMRHPACSDPAARDIEIFKNYPVE